MTLAKLPPFFLVDLVYAELTRSRSAQLLRRSVLHAHMRLSDFWIIDSNLFLLMPPTLSLNHALWVSQNTL